MGVNGPRTKDVPLIIFTTAMNRDKGTWVKELANFAIAEEEVIIDSWNNIGKYTDLRDHFIIFDEQRLVGSGAWVKSFYKMIQHNKWILLSATPGDVWLDFVPVFVAHGYFKNKTDFANQHVVYSNWGGFPKVDRYVNTQPLERMRKRLLVEIPFNRHTTRHIAKHRVAYDEERFNRVWKDRWNVEEERPILDVAELFRVARRIVNSDPSRIDALRELLVSHPRLIVFYNFNYELDILRSLAQQLQPTVETAEWNGQKHQPVPSSTSWLYFVQYTAGAEGWECTTTDAMVFFSLNYSYKVWAQAQGRIDRLNTPFVDLFYYILFSESPIDKAIYKANRLKKSFNERGFARKLVA